MKVPLRILTGILVLCTSCTSLSFAQDKTEEMIRVDTALVNIPVIVSDRENRYIPGLTAANFKVFQDGAEQKIEVFNNEEAPMNIVLALDTSHSTELVLDKIKKAAKKFINILAPGDRAMIVSFDNDYEVLSALTSDKKALKTAVENAEIGDRVGTVIYDALHACISKELKKIKGRKAIIVLTDGMDFGSYIAERDLQNELSESDTVIYPVFYEVEFERPRPPVDRFPGPVGGMGRGRRGGMGGGFPGGRGGGRPPGGRGGRGNRPNAERMKEMGLEFLQKVADNTSGRLYQQKVDDLDDVFRQIADEMKRQYLVGFYPPEGSASETVHQIKVQVDKPNVSVRTRTTYRTRSR